MKFKIVDDRVIKEHFDPNSAWNSHIRLLKISNKDFAKLLYARKAKYDAPIIPLESKRYATKTRNIFCLRDDKGYNLSRLTDKQIFDDESPYIHSEDMLILEFEYGISDSANWGELWSWSEDKLKAAEERKQLYLNLRDKIIYVLNHEYDSSMSLLNALGKWIPQKIFGIIQPHIHHSYKEFLAIIGLEEQYYNCFFLGRLDIEDYGGFNLTFWHPVSLRTLLKYFNTDVEIIPE